MKITLNLFFLVTEMYLPKYMFMFHKTYFLILLSYNLLITENILVLLLFLLSHSVVSGSLQLHGLVAHEAPLFMEFSRQEYWNGLQFPTPRDLPDPGIEPTSLVSPALAGGFFTSRTTWEAYIGIIRKLKMQKNKLDFPGEMCTLINIWRSGSELSI